jgi:hypothetical protein
MKSWKQLLSTMWSKFDSQFQNIISRIDSHAALVDTEAAAASFADAYEFRKKALLAFEKAEDDRERQTFQHLKEWLSPMSFEDDLQRSGDMVNGCPNTGNWFLLADEFTKWLDPGSSSPVIWLSGIPGSGKHRFPSTGVD